MTHWSTMHSFDSHTRSTEGAAPPLPEHGRCESRLERNPNMLIPQRGIAESSSRQGGRTVTLSELRKSLSEPRKLTDWHRQRLLELAQRLSRVQGLGDEYARVDLSNLAWASLQGDRVGG